MQKTINFQNPVSKQRKKVTIVRPLTNYKKEYVDQYNQDNQDNQSTISLNASQSTSQHIKMSVRLPRGIVTSLTIKKNIIALWLLYREPLKDDPEQICYLLEQGKSIKEDTISTMVNTFVYKCLEDWDYDTGKGLSDFVTELMIEQALEHKDHSIYLMIMGGM